MSKRRNSLLPKYCVPRTYGAAFSAKSPSSSVDVTSQTQRKKKKPKKPPTIRKVVSRPRPNPPTVAVKLCEYSNEAQAAALDVAKSIEETDSKVVIKIAALIDHLGEVQTLELVKQACALHKTSPILTLDGTRRRTLGGIFFMLAKPVVGRAFDKLGRRPTMERNDPIVQRR